MHSARNAMFKIAATQSRGSQLFLSLCRCVEGLLLLLYARTLTHIHTHTHAHTHPPAAATRPYTHTYSHTHTQTHTPAAATRPYTHTYSHKHTHLLLLLLLLLLQATTTCMHLLPQQTMVASVQGTAFDDTLTHYTYATYVYDTHSA
jgi:hypothetical protein